MTAAESPQLRKDPRMFGRFRRSPLAPLEHALEVLRQQPRPVQQQTAQQVRSSPLAMQQDAVQIGSSRKEGASSLLRETQGELQAMRRRLQAAGIRADEPRLAKVLLQESVLEAILDKDGAVADAAMGQLDAWLRDVGVPGMREVRTEAQDAGEAA